MQWRSRKIGDCLWWENRRKLWMLKTSEGGRFWYQVVISYCSCLKRYRGCQREFSEPYYFRLT